MPSLASSSPLKSGSGRAVAAILAVSIAATLFLFWLIYLHPAPDGPTPASRFYPR
jgi:hypothetical protein